MDNTRGFGLPTSGKILGPDGKPWQVDEGYDPGFALPHVLTFAGMVGAAWKTYFHHADQAVQKDPQFATEAMLNDLRIRGCLQERHKAVESLKFQVKVDDETSPTLKAIKDSMTQVVDATKRRRKMTRYLLWAIFQGKYGAQLKWGRRDFEFPNPANPKTKIVKSVPIIEAHRPVDGDKIGWCKDGTPYVLVHGSAAGIVPNASAVSTTVSRAFELRGEWRSKFIIHTHDAIDANFWKPEQAAKAYGVGIRDVLFFFQWLKMEWLGAVADWCERAGMGVRIWKYRAGSKESKRAVEDAAKSQTGRTNILLPVFETQGRPIEGVEYVDTVSTGADLMLRLIEYIDDLEERYIIGQSLSASPEGNGLGGAGVASFQASTKMKLIASDANDLGETYTEDWIQPIVGWVWGWQYAHLVSIRPMIDQPEPEKTLGAVTQAFMMGVDFPKEEIRELTTIRAPREGEEVISQAIMQASQQNAAGGGAPPAAPGEPVAAGGEEQDGDVPSEEDIRELLAEIERDHHSQPAVNEGMAA